jgi:anaerobic magnesium-protoporphyrin IX monomethyl ester cyclase
MNNSKGKVLFLYPNPEGYGGIPNGLALLSGCLRKAGFETRCFDTTFLSSQPKTLFFRQKHGGMLPADYLKYWGEWSPELAAQVPELFCKEVAEFQPDLIAVSLAEVCYEYALKLLQSIKQHFDIPVIAGGIFATLCPEEVISNPNIDIVCVGEGEDALVELAECIVAKRDYSKIRNLWIKQDNSITKNELRPLKNMDDLPFQDWSIFDERHVYKPYCGDFRRTAFVELARGCHFNCSFCCTASLRKIYKDLGKYVRTRDVDKTMDEVAYLMKAHNLELVFFTDDNFMGMAPDRFHYFCDQYKKRIDLPFYIQTRSEVVTEEFVKRLKEINISTIAIGVEHGDENLRKKHLNRHMNNEDLIRAFNIVHKYGIRSTANLIIGMPGEMPHMFKETIELIRKINPSSYSINFFQPYRGTLLREKAVEAGFIRADHLITESNVCLDMPEFSRERITDYYENFKKYLDGELNIHSDF